MTVKPAVSGGTTVGNSRVRRLGRRLLVAIGVVALACALGAVFLIWALPDPKRMLHSDEYRFESIAVGMTEDQVAKILGPPDLHYTREDAPNDYCWPGYECKRRPISGKVLIYKGLVLVTYVYLNEKGTVEEVFAGGT